MTKIEFKLLCENCLQKSQSCQVPIANLIKLGFNKKNIKQIPNGDTYCVIASKNIEKSKSDDVAQQILNNDQNHIVQVIIKPKLF